MFVLDSLKIFCSFVVDGKIYYYYSFLEVVWILGDFGKLLMLLKVLLENFLCWEDGSIVIGDDFKVFVGWFRECCFDCEIQYCLVWVLMQDFIGVFVVVDLVVMCVVMVKVGGDLQKINLLLLVDLVIDYLVMVDKFVSELVFEQNVEIEMQCNGECYVFLCWGQNVFDNFSVVLLGIGICYQVNLEYLGCMVWIKDEDGRIYVFFDILVGIDFYIIMINGFGVFGWGVGGIEVEVVMFGQLVLMLIFEVIGFKFIGKLCEGIIVIDLVLIVMQMLCKKGVVGKFVEFYGDGLVDLFLVDCVIIVNMVLEYGVICGFFLVDEIIFGYLCLFGCLESMVKLVEVYSKEQGLWCEKGYELVFIDILYLDMGEVEVSLVGLKCLQDCVVLQNVVSVFNEFFGL